MVLPQPPWQQEHEITPPVTLAHQPSWQGSLLKGKVLLNKVPWVSLVLVLGLGLPLGLGLGAGPAICPRR